MAISFDLVPVNLRTPGRYVEFDATQATRGLTGIPFTTLLLGQKHSAGGQAVDTLVRVVGVADALEKFGEKSILYEMAKAYFAVNRTAELWAIVLADDGAAAAATGSIAFTGPATESGTLFLYVAGHRITVGITSGDAATDVAAAVAAAITADTGVPVTAVVNGVDDTQVDLTALPAGEVGNSYDVRVNYFSGEETPAGVGSTITGFIGGTSNPDITAAITAMGEEWFNVVVMPYLDAANLLLLKTEMESRWGPIRSIEGGAFAARRDTQSGLLTWGDGMNDQFLSVMGVQGPTSPHVWAADIAARVAFEAQQDPARPLQTLNLPSVLAPNKSERWTQAERNALLHDGISTFTVDSDGTVRVERLITTYQENPAGAPDTAFLDVTTLYTLGFLRFSFRNRFAQKFPRKKLADNGTRAPNVITPKTAEAEVIALFRDWEDAGLVENIDQFKNDLVVERDADDPNRLNLLLPPDLVNQLRVVAGKVEFRL